MSIRLSITASGNLFFSATLSRSFIAFIVLSRPMYRTVCFAAACGNNSMQAISITDSCEIDEHRELAMQERRILKGIGLVKSGAQLKASITNILPGCYAFRVTPYK